MRFSELTKASQELWHSSLQRAGLCNCNDCMHIQWDRAPDYTFSPDDGGPTWYRNLAEVKQTILNYEASRYTYTYTSPKPVEPKWKAVTCASRHVKLFTEDECDTS